MKSVLCMGRYCIFWVESPYPSPNQPPEPIARRLCTSWYPLPWGSCQGFRKDITRIRWYSFTRILVVPNNNPPSAVKERLKSLTPEANAISHIKIPISPAVLKFGCFRISSKRPPKLESQSNFWSPHNRFQLAKIFAAWRITNGLTNSDGCICNAPITSQRLAPLTLLPKNKVARTKMNPNQKPGPAIFSQLLRFEEMIRKKRLQLAPIHINCRLR